MVGDRSLDPYLVTLVWLVSLRRPSLHPTLNSDRLVMSLTDEWGRYWCTMMRLYRKRVPTTSLHLSSLSRKKFMVIFPPSQPQRLLYCLLKQNISEIIPVGRGPRWARSFSFLFVPFPWNPSTSNFRWRTSFPRFHSEISSILSLHSHDDIPRPF